MEKKVLKQSNGEKPIELWYWTVCVILIGFVLSGCGVANQIFHNLMIGAAGNGDIQSAGRH